MLKLNFLNFPKTHKKAMENNEFGLNFLKKILYSFILVQIIMILKCSKFHRSLIL